MKTLRDIGEDELIRRLIRLAPLDPSPLAGPGDDCAVIDLGPDSALLQLLKTDAMVAGIHFLPDTPPRAIGWKAAARVVSDFAAMGGRPERFLVTLALDPRCRGLMGGRTLPRHRRLPRGLRCSARRGRNFVGARRLRSRDLDRRHR